MEGSSNQHFTFKEVLAHCSRQAKRVKKLTRSANTFAKQAKLQSEKVHLLTKEAAEAISNDISKCSEEQGGESTTEIRAKFEDLLSNENDVAKAEPAPSFNNTIADQETATCSRLPFVSIPSGFQDDYGDEMSDNESEYFPDWSSADSYASSSGSRSRLRSARQGEDYFSDDEIFKLSEDDFDDLAEDDDSELCLVQYSGISLTEELKPDEFSNFLSQPIPAAGNDVPGPSNQAEPPQANSSNDKGTIKSHALRRVKSMVLENDLEDGITVGKRMFVLQQKRNNSSVTSQPSPLLSSNDVTSLKKTPSQVNARYSLKRSRSNISTQMTSFKRGELTSLGNRNDVILEENEEEDEE